MEKPIWRQDDQVLYDDMVLYHRDNVPASLMMARQLPQHDATKLLDVHFLQIKVMLY